MSNISEWFEKYGDEDLQFGDIPATELLHPDRKLCAMLKIASLMNDPSRFWLSLCAEHDVIYLPTPSEYGEPKFQREFTDDELVYLRRCGVHWSSETDTLAMFV